MIIESVFGGSDPLELLTARSHSKLHLLLHPEWWTETAMSIGEKWNAMLADNFALMQQSLLGREATYNNRRSIPFGLIGDDQPRRHR